jgi:hypothetical protein
MAVLAASYITFCICSSGIMASTRQWIRLTAQSNNLWARIPFHHLKRLVGCPFCTGFWVVVGIELVFHFNFFPTHGIWGEILTVPAITMPAAMLAWVGSNMVGSTHRALQALDEAEAKERQALADAQGVSVEEVPPVAIRN